LDHDHSNIRSTDSPALPPALGPLSVLPDPAWSIWDVLMVVGVFVLSLTLSAGAVFGLASSFLDELAKKGELATNPLLSVPIQLIAYLLTFVFARFYLASKSRQRFWEAVKWNLPAPHRIAQLIALGAILAVTVQFASAQLPTPKNLPVEQYFRSADSIWLLAVFGTLIAPLAEEVFFRGLLFPALRRLFTEPESIAGLGILLWFMSAIPFVWVFYRYQRISRVGVALLVLGLVIVLIGRLHSRRSPLARWNVPVAVIVTALLFALMHQGQLARAWSPLLMLFVVGVVLTTVRALWDSLAASWIVHAAYNGTLFVWLYLGTSGFRNLENLSS
jgi:membrane protease YdiL (CAAX protease family)